jgi:hypothetical protein
MDQTTVSVFQRRKGQGDDYDAATTTATTTYWSKLLQTTLKKIHVGDLGDWQRRNCGTIFQRKIPRDEDEKI